MERKSTGFLKFIILYKTVMGTSELILSYYLFKVFKADPGAVVPTLVEKMRLDVDNFIIGYLVDKANQFGSDTVLGIIIVIFTFSVLNLVESWGLHLKRRWAEWLTVVGTSALIPFELYEVIRHFSALAFVIMVINCTIVYYLAKHKELFKSRKEELKEEGVNA